MIIRVIIRAIICANIRAIIRIFICETIRMVNRMIVRRIVRLSRLVILRLFAGYSAVIGLVIELLVRLGSRLVNLEVISGLFADYSRGYSSYYLHD